MSSSVPSTERGGARSEAAPAGPRPRRGRGPRWERRKDSRPSELLDAALELFVERGFAGTRLEDVAARAGVSKGTLYLYYDNKEELLKAVVRTSIVPLIDENRATVQTYQGPIALLLAQFLDNWWHRFGATRLAGIMKLVISESGNFPEVAVLFNDEVVTPNMAVVATILERGVAAGEFHCEDLSACSHWIMAPLVLKAIWANSMEHCCGAMATQPAVFIRHHVDLVLRAIGGPANGRTGSASAPV